MEKKPSIWDKIPQYIVDETLAAIASEDPRAFRSSSEFVANVRAKIAANKRDGLGG